MAKIKNTKTELKAQKDALARYEKFLPMLQLKKQQLQAEIGGIRAQVERLEALVAAEEESLRPWIGLLAEADGQVSVPIAFDGIETGQGNIAGVVLPVFKSVRTRRLDIDLHDSPTWLDDAAEAAARLVAWKAEIDVLREQRRLVEEELRTTSQRVNLFEKVKIPESKENIRVIRIHIGDEQTSAVARGKIAKGRGSKATPSAVEGPAPEEETA